MYKRGVIYESELLSLSMVLTLLPLENVHFFLFQRSGICVILIVFLSLLIVEPVHVFTFENFVFSVLASKYLKES